MDKLEIAKERLKGSITRLENIIEEKFFKLKSENDRLKLENTSLKKQLAVFENTQQGARRKTITQEAPTFELNTPNELTISLDELKKLAG